MALTTILSNNNNKIIAKTSYFIVKILLTLVENHHFLLYSAITSTIRFQFWGFGGVLQKHEWQGICPERCGDRQKRIRVLRYTFAIPDLTAIRLVDTAADQYTVPLATISAGNLQWPGVSNRELLTGGGTTVANVSGLNFSSLPKGMSSPPSARPA